MMLKTIAYTFALVLACGPEKDIGGAETASTGETQTASTGSSDPTEATTDPTTEHTSSTTTGVASTGDDDGTVGSTSGSSMSTGGETDATGTTDATTGELPPGECRSDADCSAESFESCFAPGELNCGACMVPETPCTLGDACGPGLVYAPFMGPCACNPGEGACVPVCDAESCGREATCNPMTGLCEPWTCFEDGPACPPFFVCAPGRGGEDDRCERQACAVDSDCFGTPCVEGFCYGEYGVCQPPAP